MLIAAVLLITTTIRLSAMSRRRETGIMRLVGASNLFIQLPFMLEGALSAFVGALLATAALWGGVSYLIPSSGESTSVIVQYVTTSQVLTIAPFLIVAAVVLAAVSSLVTLSRYMKV
jgi:cell division transport system permease protein